MNLVAAEASYEKTLDWSSRKLLELALDAVTANSLPGGDRSLYDNLPLSRRCLIFSSLRVDHSIGLFARSS